MNDTDPLRIYEKAMLLILKDKQGTVGISLYNYALAGALLSELFLEERLVAEGKHHTLIVSDPTPVGNELLDECLDLIHTSPKERAAQYWITHIANIKNLKHRIARILCQRGILREDEDKELLFFTRKIYPEVDPEPEQALVAELEEAIFTDTDELTPHTVALISLGNSTGLLNSTFDRKELKKRKERLEAIANGEVASAGCAAAAATAAAQEAMNGAIFVCIILPTIIT